MYKLAFFVEMEHETRHSYQTVLEGRQMKVMVCGINSMEMAWETARELAGDGYDEIQLCGAFDENKAHTISNASGGNLMVSYETYSSPEMEKFLALESLNPMGIILHVGNEYFEKTSTTLCSDEADTHVVLVDSMEAALKAAQDLVSQGVKFIELGTYFDKDKAEQLIQGIQGVAPIGYPVKVKTAV